MRGANPMDENTTRVTAALQRWLPYHSATYYNTLVQLFAGTLAMVWLLRSLSTRGVVHTARVAATKSGS